MERTDRPMGQPVARPAPARGRRKRRHAAGRARLIAGAMSVGAFVGLGSGMAIGGAQTASPVASSSASSSSSKSASSSSTWAATPAQSTTSHTPVSVSHGS